MSGTAGGRGPRWVRRGGGEGSSESSSGREAQFPADGAGSASAGTVSGSAGGGTFGSVAVTPNLGARKGRLASRPWLALLLLLAVACALLAPYAWSEGARRLRRGGALLWLLRPLLRRSEKGARGLLRLRPDSASENAAAGCCGRGEFERAAVGASAALPLAGQPQPRCGAHSAFAESTAAGVAAASGAAVRTGGRAEEEGGAAGRPPSPSPHAVTGRRESGGHGAPLARAAGALDGGSAAAESARPLPAAVGRGGPPLPPLLWRCATSEREQQQALRLINVNMSAHARSAELM